MTSLGFFFLLIVTLKKKKHSVLPSVLFLDLLSGLDDSMRGRKLLIRVTAFRILVHKCFWEVYKCCLWSVFHVLCVFLARPCHFLQLLRPKSGKWLHFRSSDETLQQNPPSSSSLSQLIYCCFPVAWPDAHIFYLSFFFFLIFQNNPASFWPSSLPHIRPWSYCKSD